ncbi:MAG: beta-N-acetylhexosaminidase [Spirochaetales bacterium]|nr:beta-N-acetylhexosaminidase [Spirochaetales bacterium]
MENSFAIVPDVKKITSNSSVFSVSSQTKVFADNSSSLPAAILLAHYIQNITTLALPIREGESVTPQDILLSTENSENVLDQNGFTDETYTLSIDDSGCHLSALYPMGLFRGVQVLRQLLSTHSTNLPGCHIEDSPRFRWRGVHLDVSRHFFDEETVCRFIDAAAYHRLNVVHLHLTDDQGWRMPIDAFPRLTSVASKRECTVLGHQHTRPRTYNDQPHEGFYTKEQIQNIVEFAAQRGVHILPEIDMPGHMQAAITAYPEWGCTQEKPGVRCSWGISQHILNPNESTMKAMETILDEVMELFPWTFIHIGGDEAHKYQWDESREVQERMAELGATSEEELQSRFIARMANHVASRGRKAIGWDEILEGGLAENASVMSWRGEEGGIEAAKKGHDVVMAPMQSTYFDHYQGSPETEPLGIGGLTTLEKAYMYNPLPQSLSPEESRFVMGTQAQLWTEYIPNSNHLDYMTYPRLCAFAEAAWRESEKVDYPAFLERMQIHKKRMEELGIQFAPIPTTT